MHNFFLPHPDTHKKAHLISWYGLLSYLLIFIFVQVLVNVAGNIKPGVLGIDSDVQVAEIIELTNKEREKRGLPALNANSKLSIAAGEKAKNMLEENYWAHYSPSGKDPWGFITGAGYRYSVAGENLARNFYSSEDVVVAWMESPTHRDNLLNGKYRDIGIAVVEGVLQGQKTVLVVQEFGSESGVATLSGSDSGSVKQLAGGVSDNLSLGTTGRVLSSGAQFSIDPYFMIKVFGGGLLAFVGVLLLVDLYILSRRGVVRVSSYHMPHLALVGAGIGFLWTLSPGSIL